jgi:hypothetical protein
VDVMKETCADCSFVWFQFASLMLCSPYSINLFFVCELSLSLVTCYGPEDVKKDTRTTEGGFRVTMQVYPVVHATQNANPKRLHISDYTNESHKSLTKSAVLAPAPTSSFFNVSPLVHKSACHDPAAEKGYQAMRRHSWIVKEPPLAGLD